MRRFNPPTNISPELDAIVKDYNQNKETFNKVNCKPNSVSYFYFEKIYLKYSAALNRFMKKNKNKIQLGGGKKFRHMPIELFIKESNRYKAEVMEEFSKSNNFANIKKGSGEFYLTPLPFKPRQTSLSSAEKREFFEAERTAVAMRKVEYTASLKNVYLQLKDEQKQQMVYIYQRAANIIKSWWRRIKNKSYAKQCKFNDIIMSVTNKKNKQILKIAFNKIKNYLSWRKRQKMQRIYSFSLKACKQRVIIKQCFYTKKIFTNYIKDGYFLFGRKPSKPFDKFEKIILIQKNVKAFLNRKKRNVKKKKILHRSLTMKERDLKIDLGIYFHRWMLCIFRQKFAKRLMSLKEMRKCKQLPVYLSLLPSVVQTIVYKRLKKYFDTLRKGVIKSTKQFVLYMEKYMKWYYFKTFKNNLKFHVLKRAIIKADKQGKRWKNFQLWYLRNLIVKIFIERFYKALYNNAFKIFKKNIRKINEGDF